MTLTIKFTFVLRATIFRPVELRNEQRAGERQTWCDRHRDGQRERERERETDRYMDVEGREREREERRQTDLD